MGVCDVFASKPLAVVSTSWRLDFVFPIVCQLLTESGTEEQMRPLPHLPCSLVRHNPVLAAVGAVDLHEIGVCADMRVPELLLLLFHKYSRPPLLIVSRPQT